MRILSIAVFITLLISSCDMVSGERIRGNGIMGSAERRPGEFDKVRSAGFFDVVLRQGDEHTVRIEAEENILEYIETYIEGGTLHITARDGYSFKTGRDAHIYISSPNYTEVALRGSGDLSSEGQLRNDDRIHLSLSGSGDIDVNIKCPELITELSGSGDIDISGETRDFNATLRGSGNIEAFDLRSENAAISISGSGNADVYASINLKVDIRGSGDVKYRGGANLSSDIKGSGNIKKAD